MEMTDGNSSPKRKRRAKPARNMLSRIVRKAKVSRLVKYL